MNTLIAMGQSNLTTMQKVHCIYSPQFSVCSLKMQNLTSLMRTMLNCHNYSWGGQRWKTEDRRKRSVKIRLIRVIRVLSISQNHKNHQKSVYQKIKRENTK